MSTIREIMSTNLITVAPGASVAEAATVMGGRHAGSVLVVDEGRLAGIFTERDVLRALASDFDASHHTVDEWMTRDPMTITPDADVREALDHMLEEGYRHMPVMEGGELVGVVSIRDLSLVVERDLGSQI